ncbi:DeoR/GlpR family DNA-binding transcription regulator [Ammoniphilus sp. YIM 78166]|uniref:DeoR/GlpR family DNA-binding transcription regulator n=1 Tax=Ammoniphilus sp. YIM 78166 TaxID=1644106 RepID=UPI0010705C30|nr:DeoR/GlpR family DNA-binding transcription regulator [Ammoniphilus sp. YIM 78166]
MLTPERHQMIIHLLKTKDVVRLQELVDLTGASESTIRRDLSELEEKKILKRVHGGASILHRKLEEPSIQEKVIRHEQEKVAIARFAAGLVQEGDTIYLDAGTTTYQMVPYLHESIAVVTNSIQIGVELLKRNIRTFLLGGELKPGTLALVGPEAIRGIGQYRFDKCFLGMNSVHDKYGLTTPDPDEAYIKQLALHYSDEKFVVCDSNKFSQVSFAKVADLDQVTIITNDGLDEDERTKYGKLTQLQVVKS